MILKLIAIWCALSVVTAWLFGGLIERDRKERFPTVADKTPRAVASRRQLRSWRRNRLVLPVGNRRVP